MVPYDAALPRMRLFSLARRRIRGGLICMDKIMQGLHDFPNDAVFAAPSPIELRGNTFKIHQQRCKTRLGLHDFSVRVVPSWSKLPEEIENASSIETFKLRLNARWQSQKFPSNPSPILPPDFVQPCRIPPLCHYYNYSWSPIVVLLLTRPINVI